LGKTATETHTENETISPRRDKTSNAHHSRRTTMLRKTILGIAAAASLSAVALAPTTASAGGFWPHHHHHHHHGFGFGIGYGGGGYDGCYVTRRVFTPYGVAFRTVNVCAY
jgi:hypothetical protein